MNQEILETYFPGLVVKDEDRGKCENYLKLKGIERYSSLYFAIKDKTDKEIDYELLSQHYRYDVKLRRALHKIIAFTEVAMRAAICNAYPNVEFTSRNWKNRISNIMGKPFETGEALRKKISWYVQKLENEGKTNITLFDLLENSDLQVLNAVFLMLDEDKQREVFTNDFEHLKDNLDAMRELRNCVEHHQVLIIQKLKEVWICGTQQSGLKANVENIINISPKVAKANLKRLINDCLTIDEEQKRSKENTYQLLPAFKVYFEDVE